MRPLATSPTVKQPPSQPQEAPPNLVTSTSSPSNAQNVDLILDTFRERDVTVSGRPTCQIPDPKLMVTFEGESFLFSWLQRSGRDAQKSWNDAVAFCKSKCMDLVSVDSTVSRAKAEFLDKAAKEADVYGFWTGAFFSDGNLWQWQADGSHLDVDKAFSKTGFLQGQPDNYMGRATGGLTDERCAAVLNNWFGIEDDVTRMLHDFVCDVRLPFVCQNN